jgi:hypothetical protein
MSLSVLQIIESSGGWSLIDDGKPSLWFPDRNEALEIACLMADARSLTRSTDTLVQIAHKAK